MMIACPHCSHAASVPDGAAGKKATCPSCRAKFVVQPVTQPAQNPFDFQQPDLAEPEDLSFQPSPRQQETGGFRCPFCGTTQRPRHQRRLRWGVWLVLFFPIFPLVLMARALLDPKRAVCSGCRMTLSH